MFQRTISENSRVLRDETVATIEQSIIDLQELVRGLKGEPGYRIDTLEFILSALDECETATIEMEWE